MVRISRFAPYPRPTFKSSTSRLLERVSLHFVQAKFKFARISAQLCHINTYDFLCNFCLVFQSSFPAIFSRLQIASPNKMRFHCDVAVRGSLFGSPLIRNYLVLFQRNRVFQASAISRPKIVLNSPLQIVYDKKAKNDT